jgi:UDP-glucose 4-epimerase
MKTVVFGGAGFLGSYVVDSLISRGHEVLVYDLNESSTRNKNAKYIKGDILNSSGVLKAIEGSEIVYNFAGLADLNESISNPRMTLEPNIMGNLNINHLCIMVLKGLYMQVPLMCSQVKVLFTEFQKKVLR